MSSPIYLDSNSVLVSTKSGLKRLKTPFKVIVCKDMEGYKIGDELTIGFPSAGNGFSFITYGDGFVVPFTPLPKSCSNTKTVINKIIVGGNKKSGFVVLFKSSSSVFGIPPNISEYKSHDSDGSDEST